MPRILLVKTSSLGDVVHNLPVVADIAAALPDAEIDWVVEEAFAPIPRLHPQVSRVLPVAVRRWRRGLCSVSVWREVRAFISELRGISYDAVIDTQGLLKSAWIARAAHGERHGLDRQSAREPLGFFYDHTHAVPWGQHAVERNRRLAAQALGYTVSSTTQYGISSMPRVFPWMDTGKSYAVLLHATSADRKLWPEDRWIELGCALIVKNIISVLPWGTSEEHERSKRLAQYISQAVIPERMELSALAALLAQSRVVVGTDTGLTHLAGALGVPTAGIYCATDPAATGLYACKRSVNLGGINAAPVTAEVVAAVEGLL